jgi:hypothetical protein
MPTMTVCDFCGHRSPRAKEHIWPDWLLRQFGIEKSTMANTHIAVAGGSVSKRVQSASSMLYGGVCNTCNNGWMSQLESEVKPILTELISSAGSKDALLGNEANVLALWAFKTAIVRNAGTNYRCIVPKEHYQYLYKEKKIPPGVYVDLGLCPSHSGLSALQSQTLLGFLLSEDAGAVTQLQRHLYNITLAVGPLLLRTIYFPLRGYTVLTTPSLAGGTRRLHPSAGCSLKFTQHCEHPIDFETDAYFVANNGSNTEA